MLRRKAVFLRSRGGLQIKNAYFDVRNTSFMKSLVCMEPRGFKYIDADDPEWHPGTALLRIKRLGICGTDIHAFEGTQPYFSYPRILGHEIAAEIVKTDAAGFMDNERVTIIPYFHCSKCAACRMGKPNCCADLKVCGVHIDGAMSAYFSVPSSSLLHGNALTLDELALVEPFSIGAHATRRAGIKQDDFALIIGAGPIGLATMEFARIAGADVIIIDTNEARLGFCKEKLHVKHIIHPGSGDTMKQLQEITNGDMPGVVFDATGNLGAINNAFQYISHGGKYVLVGLQKDEIKFSHPEFHKREATLMSSRNATREDFLQVMGCIKERWINPEVYITHRMKFDQVKDEFENLLDPGRGVVKSLIEFD
jgi:2-desacetyl-2-hydroxyethyl bacteriochlorophyllide A dehydrogenase